MYELDEFNRVWCKGEIVGLKKTFLMEEKEFKSDKMVVVLAETKKPAQMEFVWVKDTKDKLWLALTTTLSGICDLDTITEKLDSMMEWE